MRVLPGLLVAAALLAQPAAAAAKDKQDNKAARQEEKAERKPAHEEPAAPAGRPAATQVAAPPAKVRPAQPRAPKRKPPAPLRSSPAPPSPPPAPAPQAAPAPAVVANPAPAATPGAPAARTAASPPHRRPRARRRAPRAAVLGYRATGSRAPRTARHAAPVATLAPALPAAVTRRALAAVRPERAPARPVRPAVVAPPAAGPVTRVVSVVPPPLRIALAVLAALVAVLTLRARRLERQRQGLSDDLGLLQSALLPELPPRIAGAWVSAAYLPAEGLAAGGDFYDAFALDAHRTCLLVGDVAGHGRDAIPLTADVRFTLRAYLEAGLGPRAALAATAEVVEPRLGGRFVTVVVAILDARTGRLTYAAAGHPPPLLTGAGERLLTACACPAIGTGLPTGRRQTTLTLPPGATACFYTDGLCDAESGGRRLGPGGVERYLRALGPRAQAAALLGRIVRDTDPQPDDMAACLLRSPLGAVGTTRERVEELEVDAADAGRALRFLLACGVAEEEADEALEAALGLLPVVLQVTCTSGGAAVAVQRPDVVALPLPQ